MKLRDMQKYAPISENAENTYIQTVASLKEDSAFRKKVVIRPMIAFVLVIALTTTALAMTMHASILDFFAKWGEAPFLMNPDNYKHVVLSEGPLYIGSVGDIDITATDIQGDGIDYMFVINVALRDGSNGVLMDVYQEGENVTIDWDVEAPQRGVESEVYYVRPELRYNQRSASWGDVIYNDDGSISYFEMPRVYSLEDEALIECTLTLYTGTPDGEIDHESKRIEKFSFFMPTMEMVDSRKSTEEVEIGTTGIHTQIIAIKKTNSGVYCDICFVFREDPNLGYSIPGREGIPGMEGLSFVFLDEDGTLVESVLIKPEQIPTNTSTINASYRLVIDEIPKSIIIEAYDNYLHKPLGEAEIGLK